jgi:transcriptional regulator with XRE-family HTH domain
MGMLDSEGFNEIGQFIFRERGNRSISQIAREGNISEPALRRLMRSKLDQLPPAMMMQGIADGLGMPLAYVHDVALDACGVDLGREYNRHQQAVADAMTEIPVNIQRVLSEHLPRLFADIAEMCGGNEQETDGAIDGTRENV